MHSIGIKFFLILVVVMSFAIFQPNIKHSHLIKVTFLPIIDVPPSKKVYEFTTDIIPLQTIVWSAVSNPLPRKRVKPTVDKVLIKKSKQALLLMEGKRVVKSYLISLGFSPKGHKERAGDGKTPEGRYYINGRNPRSRYHRSLKISYPNADDIARAKAKGVDPGSDIMIHGIEKKLCYLGKSHVTELWTRGCVVVTNQEIDEIWNLVPDGTVVEIQA